MTARIGFGMKTCGEQFLRIPSTKLDYAVELTAIAAIASAESRKWVIPHNKSAWETWFLWTL